MTSQPPPDPSGHDRDHLGPDGSEPLDPDQEAVRGLLAEAGGRPETLPADVATRLDDVLAGLVAARPAAASAVPASPAGLRLTFPQAGHKLLRPKELSWNGVALWRHESR